MADLGFTVVLWILLTPASQSAVALGGFQDIPSCDAKVAEAQVIYRENDWTNAVAFCRSILAPTHSPRPRRK